MEEKKTRPPKRITRKTRKQEILKKPILQEKKPTRRNEHYGQGKPTASK